MAPVSPYLRAANGATLLSNATVSGSLSEPLGGGNYILSAECATWNGATLSLQYEGPNGTLIAVSGVSITANGVAAVTVSVGARLKAIITGSPSAGVYAVLEKVLGA